MDDHDLRQASLEQWSSAADGWAHEAARRERGASGAAAEWMLTAADLSPGQRVLELACGAGELGLRAAEAVGGTGRVVCSDFAKPMVDVAGEQARSLGLHQVETRVLDAEDPQLNGEGFDAVLCRFGYMLMAQPARALRSSLEALAPGGRLALAVWGAPEHNPWLSLLTDAVMKTLGAPPPPPGTPGPFSLAEHERIRELLDTAGFADILIEDLEFERNHDSLEHWWDTALEPSGPLSALLRQLTDSQLAAVRADATQRARDYLAADGTVRFPTRVVVASARRP